MSIADTLNLFLLDAEKRTGQKKASTRAKMKKTLRERGIIFFSLSKGLESKKEDR